MIFLHMLTCYNCMTFFMILLTYYNTFTKFDILYVYFFHNHFEIYYTIPFWLLLSKYSKKNTFSFLILEFDWQ